MSLKDRVLSRFAMAIAGKQIDRALTVQANYISNRYNDVFYQYVNGVALNPMDNLNDYMKWGFQGNEDVYSIVSKIADKLAMGGIYLQEVLPNGDRIELTNHKILDVLNDPNPNDTKYDFFYKTAVFLLINGNDYTYGIDGASKGLKVRLYPLPAQNTTIVGGDRYKPIKGYRCLYGTDVDDFSPEDILHIKIPGFDYNHSGADLYGQAPLRAAFNGSLKRNNVTNAQVNRQMKNAGTAGALTNEQDKYNLDPTQQAALKNKVKEMMLSEEDFERILIANGSLKWTQFGFNLSDLQALDTLKWDMKKLCNIFGWPEQLMNNMESSTDNNMGWAAQFAINNTIAPLGRRIMDGLNRFLVRPYAKAEGRNLELVFDTSVYPEMQQNVKEMVEWMTQEYALTPNQRLEALKFPVSKDPAMDKVYIPGNLIAIDELSEPDLLTNDESDEL